MMRLANGFFQTDFKMFNKFNFDKHSDGEEKGREKSLFTDMPSDRWQLESGRRITTWRTIKTSIQFWYSNKQTFFIRI